MSTISYDKIINRSWEITKKNKWLWVAGLVIAVFSGGSGGGGGGSSSSSTQSTPSESPVPIQENIQDKASYVLGLATDAFQTWFASVTTSDWIILGLVTFIAIFFGIFVVWVLVSWAKGALIGGFNDADQDKEVTLNSISVHGLAFIKKFILFGLVSAAMSIVLMLGLMLFVGLGILISAIAGDAATILLVVLGIILFLTFIIFAIIFTMVSIYAERLMVLNGFSPWNAWKKGFSLSKGNFFPTLLMGIINTIIEFSVGCLSLVVLLIIFAVPGYLLIWPIFENGFRMPSVPQVSAIVILVGLFFLLNLAIRAIIVVFKCGTWNLFYKEIISKA